MLRFSRFICLLLGVAVCHSLPSIFAEEPANISSTATAVQPAQSQSITGQAPGEQSRFFDSNGVKLFYQEQGAGEPVVLIHGFTLNGRLNWVLPGITSALSRDHRVITIDTRGHGRSDKPHDPAKYGLEMVEDIARLLDHLKIEKAHIVGYSMGAFITNKFVTTHPERVLSATLGGAGWGRAEDRPVFLDDLAKSLEEGKGITPLLVALTPADREPPTEEDLALTNRLLALSNDQKALAAIIRGTPGLSIPKEKLEQNRVPVLAIIGERDPLKNGVDAMDGVMANLKIVIVPGGDHMNTFSNPLFVKSLRAFLSNHATARTAPVTAE